MIAQPEKQKIIRFTVSIPPCVYFYITWVFFHVFCSLHARNCFFMNHLYACLWIGGIGKTKNGNYEEDEETFYQFFLTHPIFFIILKHKKITFIPVLFSFAIFSSIQTCHVPSFCVKFLLQDWLIAKLD